jgi:hypothetical protein
VLCSEAMKHGASCMSTMDKPDNFLTKLDETNIEEESGKLVDKLTSDKI